MTPIDIPIDLMIETLLKLPVKSLLRFRWVSKLWSSIITSRDFTNRRLNISTSSSPTRLLIAFEDFKGEKLLLVSSPNPIAPSSSPCCVPYRDLSLLKLQGKEVYNTSRDLICVRSGFAAVSICNPSTRQLHTFPLLICKDISLAPDYFFGYDPVEDQYKVLAVEYYYGRFKHKAMVLGKEEAWREVPCVACTHIPRTSGLYMNGTVYYGASSYRRKYTDDDSPNSNFIIVSFDVRLETFNIINAPRKLLPLVGYVNMWYANTLINYRGKIGVVENPREGSFRMWVVEDAEKEEWSINTFHLPESSAAAGNFKVMGTFNNGEICLVPKKLSDPFCLYYYNLEKKSMRSVIIEGLPLSELKQARHLSVTVSDHYENLITF